VEVGELVLISNSPWDSSCIFGYSNGDIAIIIEYEDTPYPIILPSVKIFIFRSEKFAMVPITYLEKLGV